MVPRQNYHSDINVSLFAFDVKSKPVELPDALLFCVFFILCYIYAYDYFMKWFDHFQMSVLSCVRSIKHYFLMDKGDFFVHFMDLTEEEMKKPVDDIVPPRLEALLELALRMSTANTDPFKDDLKVGEGVSV